MQSHHCETCRKRSYDRAYSFVYKVKYTFRYQYQAYTHFLNTILACKDEGVDLLEIIWRVSNLFRNHLELIVDFANLLPPGYRIQVYPNGQVEAIISAEEAGSTGPICYIILPGVNTNPSPHSSGSVNEAIDYSTTSRHASNGRNT